MIVLGARIAASPATGDVAFTVSEDKAVKWIQSLSTIINEGKCDDKVAQKLAGRLSFLVTLASNKIGRASINPFMRKRRHPFPDRLFHLC